MNPEGTDHMVSARRCAAQAENSLQEARLATQGAFPPNPNSAQFLIQEAQIYATLAGAYATMAGVGRMIVR